MGITIKLALLISFTFFIPDIKKLDLAHKGYISGGYFVEKNQNKAIRKFFEKIKL